MDVLENIDLYNDDCFNVFPQIEDNTINLFVLDLPYNQTACKWDQDIIPLDEMWKHIKRIMKPNGIVIMFCTAKFGYRLIHSNPKWFRYDLIWKKSRKVGFLSANKMPLRQHENIYLFKPEGGTYNPQKSKGKPYFRAEHKYVGDINDAYGMNNRAKHSNPSGDRHPTSIIDHENMYIFKSEQGTYNPQKTPLKKKDTRNRGNDGNQNIVYGDNVNLPEESIYRDRHPTSIIDHENLYVFKSEQGTYNPQKTPRDKDYKHSGKRSSEKHYGNMLECKKEYKKEDGKHPSSLIDYDGDSILIYKNPHKTIHRTQKPVELCEWLIKTCSNEGDTVMDFTMGSGTVAIGCLNTNRKFIGVEKDKEIYEKAQDRIAEHVTK